MPDQIPTPDDLTALLERLRLPPAGARTAAEVTEAQVEFLLARITALTDALRTAPRNEAARLASHVLLRDLAMVAAQFRGSANVMRESLSAAFHEALEAIQALDRAS